MNLYDSLLKRCIRRGCIVTSYNETQGNYFGNKDNKLCQWDHTIECNGGDRELCLIEAHVKAEYFGDGGRE